MKNFKQYIHVFLMTGSLFLAGCGGESKLLAFTPSSLSDCKSAVVTVNWDVRLKYPDIKNVDIFISNGTTENLFAQGDAFGSSITGSWVSPKKPLFIIKNRDNSQVLEKAYVEGPDCK